MKELKKLAFLINRTKAESFPLANRLVELAEKAGCQTRVSECFPAPDKFLAGMDACCVIGGDGTLLHIAPQATLYGVPIIGVNRGSLGFLTTFPADTAVEEFKKVLGGQFRLAKRQMLSATLGGETHLALNDLVVKEKSNAHLIEMEVWVDDRYVAEYLADGLIFSSPTGSTAYNLSAGGPIIEPSAEVFTMTPISPHTLSNRSIIFPMGRRVRVRGTRPDNEALLLCDGQDIPLNGGALDLEIRMDRSTLEFIQGVDYDYFSVLRQKLGWMGRQKGRPEHSMSDAGDKKKGDGK